MSAGTQKKLDKEAALQAPRRQSARMQSQQNTLRFGADTIDEGTISLDGSVPNAFGTPDPVDINSGKGIHIKRKFSDPGATGQMDANSNVSKKRRATSNTGSTTHRKVACESCRKRRRACKHKDTKDILYPELQTPTTVVDAAAPTPRPQHDAWIDPAYSSHFDGIEYSTGPGPHSTEAPAIVDDDIRALQRDTEMSEEARIIDPDDPNYLLKDADEIASTPKMLTHLSGAGLLRLEHRIAGGPVNGLSVLSLNAPHSRGRTKACTDCRKSKVCTL